MRNTFLKIAIFVVLLSSNVAEAEEIIIDVTVPLLKVQPYHKPYVAIWLETGSRKGVGTIALWVEQEEWYKDLRQWWRKIGRSGQPDYEAVTGATRKPGRYRIEVDAKKLQLAAGEYWVMVEASREEGGREFLRQKILLGSDLKQEYLLHGKTELGDVHIAISHESENAR